MYKSASDNDLDEVYKRLHYLEGLVRERKTQTLMQETYEKRSNILLHGLEDSDKSAWEALGETLKFYERKVKN